MYEIVLKIYIKFKTICKCLVSYRVRQDEKEHKSEADVTTSFPDNNEYATSSEERKEEKVPENGWIQEEDLETT